MIKGINLVLNGVKNTSSIIQSIEFAEQTDQPSLKKVFVVKAVFVDERDDLVNFFNGGTELKKNGRWVLVDVGGDVHSL